MAKKMHFAVILLHCPMHHSVGSWRLSRSLVGYHYARPPFWQDVARILERGKFDMLFLADGIGVSDRYGRQPNELKVLWGLMPIVGETEDAAKAKERALIEAVPPLGGITQLSTHIGYDLSRVPLAATLEEFAAENGQGLLQMLSQGLGIQGLAKMLMKENMGKAVTVAEAAQFYGSGIGPKIVGTPTQVATQLEDIFDEVGGDGFMLITHYLPGCLEEFVEMVVPILQQRGRFRKDYEGTMLREHLR